MLLGTYLIWMGCCCGWKGYTHHAEGKWWFGGDEPGTGGAISTQEFQEMVSESEYKRQSYLASVILFFIGGWILWHSVSEWRERNNLEESWTLMISDPFNVQHINQHPETYRDDFRRWIKENHPHLTLKNSKPNN
jgi:hypothetical protein